MRKRFLTLLLAATLAATSAVPVVTQPANVEAATKKTTKKSAKKTTKKKSAKKLTAKQKKAKADQAAADKVQNLIEKIYVQDNAKAGVTDMDLKKAKLAWDKLTTAQKKLVEDSDYFGRDTGDAADDDPLHWNHIGPNEILVVSFGTSFNNSRAEDIGGIENALTQAYQNKGWSVRRAFTSQIIINHVQARDNEKIDNVEQALDRAVKNGVKNLVIQPTHLMHGAEYDELVNTVSKYKEKFDTVTFSEPLLGEVGANGQSVNADKENVSKAVVAQAVSDAGFKSLADAKANDTAFVFMGHGTSHDAAITYDQMQSQMTDLKYDNVFIGTVEGKPADTACAQVIAKIKEAGYKNVVLRPLMVVAGDHANNDMAGNDADSWKSQFVASKAFDSVKCQIAGLGRISDIEQIYVQHTANALAGNAIQPKGFEGKNIKVSAASGAAVQAVSAPVSAKKTELKKGKYTVGFKTDFYMFHMNDALNGKTKLTVNKNGKMTVYVPLASTGFDKLYVGSKSNAKKKGAKYCKRKTVELNGEKAYAFTIPVKKLNTEFTIACHGKDSGKWFEHTVKVTY